MSQQLDTLRLLTKSMDSMLNEVWAVQRETPEDAYLHGALDAVYQALENACCAAEAEIRALARAEAKAEAEAPSEPTTCNCPGWGLTQLCGHCA